MDRNLVGKTIQGRYYVVRQLGRGGVGVTFLAKDQQCFDSLCVVKQLKPKTLNPQTIAVARRLFNREAEIMNRLGHCDRIPRLLAYFEQDDEFFLVQELIEGHDLSQEIVPGRPWSEAKTITLLRDILEVLLIVQQHSVIHRDLKPSNLMRRRQDGKIVLIDFGSVKQVSTQIIDAAGQVKQTVAVGTKSYMPMEQMMGRPSFHSDIYALGVVAIQALTGANPHEFGVDDSGELVWRNRLNSRVTYQPRFLELLNKMVRYRYQERYAAAELVLSDLQKLDVAQNNSKKTVIVAKNKGKNKAGKPVPPPQTVSVASEDTAIINPRQPDLASNSGSNSSSNLVSPNVPVGSDDSHRAKAIGVSLAPEPMEIHSRQKQTKSKLLIPALGILALLGLGGGWIALGHKTGNPKIELAQYENADQGFRVDYPEEWSRQNRDDFFATGVVFFSPLTDKDDRFKERVSVLVENLSERMTLEEYTQQSLAEIKQLSDPNLKSAQQITLGTNAGRQVIYAGEENGAAVRRMQTWTVIKNRAYIITYTARPEDYEQYLPSVEQIIASFTTIE